MSRAPVTQIAKLTRVRCLPKDGGRTLSFSTQNISTGRRRCQTTWLSLENVPDFEGESAWFLLERVAAVPWPYWRALRQVDPPGGGDGRG